MDTKVHLLFNIVITQRNYNSIAIVKEICLRTKITTILIHYNLHYFNSMYLYSKFKKISLRKKRKKWVLLFFMNLFFHIELIEINIIIFL